MPAHNHVAVKKISHPLLRTLGETIRLLRLRRGLSQERLAELAGIDRSYMSGIERGLRNLSILHALKLSQALHVEMYTLFQGDARRFGVEDASLEIRGDTSAVAGVIQADFTQGLAMNHSSGLLISDSAEPARSLSDWKIGQYLSLG